MALQKGERYRCPDANCGCEIEVISRAVVAIKIRAAVAAKKCSAPNLRPDAHGGTQLPCAHWIQLRRLT